MVKQLFLLIVLLTGAKSYAQQADAITGVWQMPNQKITIRIAPLVDHYQGKLIKTSVGSVFKLHVPVGFLGIYILQDITFERQNKWQGIIYNPRDKKKYALFDGLYSVVNSMMLPKHFNLATQNSYFQIRVPHKKL